MHTVGLVQAVDFLIGPTPAHYLALYKAIHEQFRKQVIHNKLTFSGVIYILSCCGLG